MNYRAICHIQLVHCDRIIISTMNESMCLLFVNHCNSCFFYIVVMVKITTYEPGETNSEGIIIVNEGLSVEVCVGVSGGTVVEREVVVHVATSDLDDEKAASK